VKRNISLFSLVVVLLGLAAWRPQNGSTAGGAGQVELSIKAGDRIADNSVVWVKNLSARSTRLVASVNSNLAQEILRTSKLVAADKTERLDESLPAALQLNDELVVRSDEQVAVTIAPRDFSIDGSEYYHPEQQQQTLQLPEAPPWVSELGGIGKTRANVLRAGSIGYAPVVKGQSEMNERYDFGIGIALTKPNSSIEIRLLNNKGGLIESVVLASSTTLEWRAELGEFISGAENFPNRVEIAGLAGRAQGFLSIKDAGSGQTTILPITQKERRGSIQTESGGDGGYAYFTNGIYDSRYTSYSYVIYGAPANVCGTLHIIRNGVEQVPTPGWVCTDAYGGATKGPWTPSTDQTGQSIYIQWPDGSRTSGGDYKVDDVSDPRIWINQSGGVGVPIPTAFDGGASDTQWGSGFNFADWSTLSATFYDVSTNKYYNGQGYNSVANPVYFYGSVSPPAGGFNIFWSVTPPPSGAHNSTDTYEWCVMSKDRFYPCSKCIDFVGPR